MVFHTRHHAVSRYDGKIAMSEATTCGGTVRRASGVTTSFHPRQRVRRERGGGEEKEINDSEDSHFVPVLIFFLSRACACTATYFRAKL